MASFGTDQENVQRLLTVQTRRLSQRTLVSTIATVIPITCIYLAIGTLLYVFYRQHPLVPRPEEAKEVLSYFVAHSLPAGLKGLLLAAIILASIDSPLSSLCSSFVTDIYRPLIRRDASERHYLWVSRLAIAGFGLVLALIAWACGPVKNVLWFAFQVFSLTGGAVLGVFLLGLLTRRKANRGNVIAMILSTALTITLMILSKREIIPLAWSWLIGEVGLTDEGTGCCGSPKWLPALPHADTRGQSWEPSHQAPGGSSDLLSYMPQELSFLTYYIKYCYSEGYRPRRIHVSILSLPAKPL
jgi:Na+/proline symporter